MVHVIILAAGKGSRMKSDSAKVVTPVKGVPIIERLLSEVTKVCPMPTLVVGYKAEEVVAATGKKYHYVMQHEQRGTGHAVSCAKADLAEKNIPTIIVLLGDHPLLQASTINALAHNHEQHGATITLATAVVPNFEGRNTVFLNYGRVIRGSDGTVQKIIEYKDATEEERAIREVNPSYYCFDARWLWKNIELLQNHNAAHELYLTDMVELARRQGKKVIASVIENTDECLGINTPEQLKMVENILDE